MASQHQPDPAPLGKAHSQRTTNALLDEVRPLAGQDSRFDAMVLDDTVFCSPLAGSATIGTEGDAAVKAASTLLAPKSAMKVDVTGYTDKTGDTTSNEALAKSRALAGKSALEAAVVSPDRVNTKPPVFVEVGPGGPTQEGRRVDIVAQ